MEPRKLINVIGHAFLNDIVLFRVILSNFSSRLSVILLLSIFIDKILFFLKEYHKMVFVSDEFY